MLFVGASWFVPYERVVECRDVKDDPYLELALEARASFIISGDQDLLVMSPWRGILIVTPADFLARHSAEARLDARIEAAIRQLYGNERIEEGRLSFLRHNLRLIFTDAKDESGPG